MKAFYDEYRGQRLVDASITTNHIVSETITLSRCLGRRVAAGIGSKVREDPLAMRAGLAG